MLYGECLFWKDNKVSQKELKRLTKIHNKLDQENNPWTNLDWSQFNWKKHYSSGFGNNIEIPRKLGFSYCRVDNLPTSFALGIDINEKLISIDIRYNHPEYPKDLLKDYNVSYLDMDCFTAFYNKIQVTEYNYKYSLQPMRICLHIPSLINLPDSLYLPVISNAIKKASDLYRFNHIKFHFLNTTMFLIGDYLGRSPRHIWNNYIYLNDL